MKTKILILLISCMLMASAASAKRIYEYTNLGALADADEFLVSDTSDSNREFAVTGAVVKTYIGTNVALTLGDLSDLKIDIGASDEDLISATPADKDLQTYTATVIDTLLLSAGSAPTIQANDPTAASANGWYLATTSGDLFYISANGMFTIAGAYSAWDIAPTAFTFTDETGIALSTAKVSDTKTVAGIDRTAAISVTGDTGFGYKKNGSACTAVAGTVVNTDTFNACVTSSGSYSTATSATVTVGSASDVYSVTTLAASAPTLSSRTIGTNGTSLTLVGSESLSVGAGGNAGFDVDCSTAGNGITATYASGAPGSSLVYTLGTTVNSGDTCDLDYTQPGNGIEATTGGADLASITSGAITNNSTQVSGVSVSDNFNRADNSTLGANWTALTGTTMPTIVSNKAKAPASARYGAYWSADTFTPDQYVTAYRVAGNAGYIMVRASNSAQSGYVFGEADSGLFLLRKLVGGTFTTLGSSYGSVSSTTIGLKVEGTTLTPYINGVAQTTVSDSTFATGQPGIFLYDTVISLDDFTATDI